MDGKCEHTGDKQEPCMQMVKDANLSFKPHGDVKETHKVVKGICKTVVDQLMN